MEPQAACALETRQTRHDVERARSNARLLTGFGLGGALLAVFVIGIVDPDEDSPGYLLLPVLFLLLATGLVGLLFLLHSVRIRRTLRRYAWTPYDVRVLPPGWGGPVVVLRDGRTQRVHVQSVVATKARWHLVADATTLWFCGEPGRRGVIARPGGAPLLYTRRILIPQVRRHHERKAEEPAGPEG